MPIEPISKLIINNQETPSISGKQISCIDPSTGKEWFKVDEADAEDVEVAIKYAEGAWPAWSELPAFMRAATLRKLAGLVMEHLDELTTIEARTMGKPKAALALDVMSCAGILNYYASLCETSNSPCTTNTPGMLSYVLHQPYGVTAGIIPWNIPMISFAFKVGASTAAGNAIILKSSEKAPITPLILGKLAITAGFPPGLIQILSGRGPTAGAALARHMKVRKISFTGSAKVGKLVQEMAAQSNLKAVTLELGGKSPAIVFPDADLEQAAQQLADSITAWNGQACIATTRVYVHSSIKSKFLPLYQAAVQARAKQGAAYESTTAHGPLVDKIQFDKVKKYIEIGKTEAKDTILGGTYAKEGEGFFVQPTIFCDVSDDATVSREEIFASVVIVNTFETEEEVIQRANDTEYGLYASVFTKNIDRAIRFSKALEAGSVGVNCTSPTLAMDMPFGGYKQSGQGRELGPEALRHWQEVKTVFVKYA